MVTADGPDDCSTSSSPELEMDLSAFRSMSLVDILNQAHCLPLRVTRPVSPNGTRNLASSSPVAPCCIRLAVYYHHCYLATIGHGLYFGEPRRGVRLYPAGRRACSCAAMVRTFDGFLSTTVACSDHRVVLLASLSSLVLDIGRICWASRVSPERIYRDLSMLTVFSVDVEWLRRIDSTCCSSSGVTHSRRYSRYPRYFFPPTGVVACVKRLPTVLQIVRKGIFDTISLDLVCEASQPHFVTI